MQMRFSFHAPIVTQKNTASKLVRSLWQGGSDLQGTQYHSNSHKNTSITLHDLRPHEHVMEPYCIFDQHLVVIGLFKGDPNNKNLTKLEHTYIHTHTHRQICYGIIPLLLFKPVTLTFIHKIKAKNKQLPIFFL